MAKWESAPVIEEYSWQSAPVIEGPEQRFREMDIPELPAFGFEAGFPTEPYGVEAPAPIEYRQPAFEAAPERTVSQKIGDFFIGKPEDRPFLPGDAGRMEKVDHTIRSVASMPVRAFVKFGKGLLLGTPELAWSAIKRVTPDSMWDASVKNMSLDEAMDWAMGYNPSGFSKAVSGVAEFAGGIKAIRGFVGPTPKTASVIDKSLRTGEVFALAKMGRELSKFGAEMIDPETDYQYEGAAGVLVDFGIGAGFSLLGSASKPVLRAIAKTPAAKAISDAGHRVIIELTKRFPVLSDTVRKNPSAYFTKQVLKYAKARGVDTKNLSIEQKAVLKHVAREAERRFAQAIKNYTPAPDIIRRGPRRRGLQIAPAEAPAAAPVAEVKPTPTKVPPKPTEAVTEGKVTPKPEIVKTIKTHKVDILPRKDEILAELDIAIKKAPEKSTEKLHFEIINVFNTKKALKYVRKRVQALPKVERVGPRKIPSKPSAALAESLRELKVTEDKEIFTTGKVMIQGKPPKSAKFITTTASGEKVRPIPKKLTDAIFATKTEPAEFSHYATKDPEVGEGASKSPVRPLGDDPAYAIFKTEKGFVHYDQRLFNSIRKRFDNPAYGIGDSGVLIATIGPEKVAAMMPTERATGQVFSNKPVVEFKEPPAEAKVVKPKAGTIADRKAREAEIEAKKKEPAIEIPSQQAGFVGKRPASVTTKISTIVQEPKTTGSEAADAFLKRTEGTKKISRPGPIRRAGAAVIQFVKEFKYLEKIPTTKEFANIREKFRHTQEIAKTSIAWSSNKMKWSLQPIKGVKIEVDARMDAVRKKLIADDLAEDVKADIELPPNLSAKDIAAMKKSADAIYEKYPSVKESYDRIRQVTKETTDSLVEQGWLKKENAKDFYFPHKVIKYLRENDSFFGISKRPAEYKKGYLKKRKGGADYQTDVLSRLSEHWAEVKKDIEYSRFLESVLKNEQKSYFDKEYPDWKKGQPVPKGYQEVIVQPGRYYYSTHGVSEDIAKALMQQQFDQIESLIESSAKEPVRKILALGKKRSWVVRSPIAEQLYDMPTAPVSNLALYKGAKHFNTFVKGQILFNPLYSIPFHSTNFMGDAIKNLVAMPSAMQPKYLVNYWKEIIKAHEGVESKRFRLAQEKGVIGSGWIGTDIPTAKTVLPTIQRAEVSGAGAVTVNGLKKLWNALVKLGAGREDWLRYALFDRLMDLQAQGQNLKQYAIKDSKILEGVTDPTDKAAKIARDLAGDYGAIGKTGRALSDTVAPFYRWMHLNIPWWPRIVKEYAKKGQHGRLAYAITVAMSPYIIAMLWNYSSEDRRKREQALPAWRRWNFHMNTKHRTWYVPLPQDDVLNFIGAPDTIADFQRYQKGFININELIRRIAIDISYEGPGLSVLNAVGGVAGIMRDAIGIQTFPEIKPWIEKRWSKKGMRIVKDIFGAPGQLLEARIDKREEKQRDLLWRSIVPFARPYTSNPEWVRKVLEEATYKKSYKHRDPKTGKMIYRSVGEPHKGKERKVELLKIQKEGLEE